jgi:hypothetical protein
LGANFASRLQYNAVFFIHFAVQHIGWAAFTFSPASIFKMHFRAIGHELLDPDYLTIK